MYGNDRNGTTTLLRHVEAAAEMQQPFFCVPAICSSPCLVKSSCLMLQSYVISFATLLLIIDNFRVCLLGIELC